MTRNTIGDAVILVTCVIAALVAAFWGVGQAPREYGLLVVVCVVGAILMARKLMRGSAG